MKQVSSDDYTFTADAVIDVNPPSALYHGDTNDVVSITPWNSIVFHCPVSASPPRLFCAKLVKQEYTEDDDINTMSSSNDDDGTHSLTPSFTYSLTYSLIHQVKAVNLLHFK